MNRSILIIAVASAIMAARAADLPGPRSRAPVVDVTDDAAVRDALGTAAQKFLLDGSAVPMTRLTSQLQHRSCELKLPPVGTNQFSNSQLAKRCLPGVLVLAGVTKVAASEAWEISPASGFLISTSGAFVTSYHVLSHPEYATVVALTGDGRVFPVIEVLAANPRTDLAIARLGGEGFTPLPLANAAEPGASVLVISHPHRQFFSTSAGVVARNFRALDEGVPSEMMAITADFGPGSSGAPVLDETGAVVAVAESIVLRMAEDGEPSALNPPFVLKHCRPVAAVWDMIHAPR